MDTDSKAAHLYHKKGPKLWIQEPTWASVRLSLEAKYSLSGPTMYCCLRYRNEYSEAKF
jgi:hypothetical protein